MTEQENTKNFTFPFHKRLWNFLIAIIYYAFTSPALLIIAIVFISLLRGAKVPIRITRWMDNLCKALDRGYKFITFKMI